MFDASLLETVLNHALQLDPAAQDKLLPLSGKSISIALDLYDEPWVLRVTDGRFVFDEYTPTSQCDVRLRGTMGGFLRLFKQNGRGSAVNEKLYIEGDLHSAQQFQQVMATLSPDFDAVFKRRFGERLGGALSSIVDQMRHQSEQAKVDIERRLQAYFQGDDAQCVTNTQFHLQQQRLNTLRMSLDRLDVRVKRLEG